VFPQLFDDNIVYRKFRFKQIGKNRPSRISHRPFPFEIPETSLVELGPIASFFTGSEPLQHLVAEPLTSRIDPAET